MYKLYSHYPQNYQINSLLNINTRQSPPQSKFPVAFLGSLYQFLSIANPNAMCQHAVVQLGTDQRISNVPMRGHSRHCTKVTAQRSIL